VEESLSRTIGSTSFPCVAPTVFLMAAAQVQGLKLDHPVLGQWVGHECVVTSCMHLKHSGTTLTSSVCGGGGGVSLIRPFCSKP